MEGIQGRDRKEEGRARKNAHKGVEGKRTTRSSVDPFHYMSACMQRGYVRTTIVFDRTLRCEVRNGSSLSFLVRPEQGHRKWGKATPMAIWPPTRRPCLDILRSTLIHVSCWAPNDDTHDLAIMSATSVPTKPPSWTQRPSSLAAERREQRRHDELKGRGPRPRARLATATPSGSTARGSAALQVAKERRPPWPMSPRDPL